MAVLELPLINGSTYYAQQVGLDGDSYSFTFKYNNRNDTWYVSISDALNNELVRSKPCLTNVISFTGRFDTNVFPIGDIIFIDQSINGLDCNIDNFGDAINLVYQNFLG